MSHINKENEINYQICYKGSLNEMLKFSEILSQSYSVKGTMQLNRIKKINAAKLTSGTASIQDGGRDCYCY